MYDFAIVALLGLVTYGLMYLAEDWVPGLEKVHTFGLFAVGVIIAVALDYSLFSAYGVAVRENWMGSWGTGLMIGGLAHVWPKLFGFLGQPDEGDATEHHHGRPRMAA
jgi:hypothetical protein